MGGCYAQAMVRPIVVTGATGNVGGEVVRACVARGLPVRATASDPLRARKRLPAGLDVVALDYQNPATFGPALAGAGALFLMRPPAIANVRTTLLPLIDESRRQGLAHIVFLSVAGAENNRIVPHHAVERHLIEGAVPHTILRPGFFSQNLTDAYRRDIAEDDRLYVPAGAGRVAFVDAADLGEVAAIVFGAPDAHRGAGYTLTGGEAVSFSEVAALLTQALGRPVRYDAASILGYAWHLRRRRKLPAMQILVQTILHVGLRRGQAEYVDPTLANLLGRAPSPLASFVRREAGVWRR